MRIGEKFVRWDHVSQWFELNEVADIPDSKGFLICYLLATCPRLEFMSLDVERDFVDIGCRSSWGRYYDSKEELLKECPTLKDFLSRHEDDEFDSWHLMAKFKDVEIRFSGQRDRVSVGVGYTRIDKPINVIPILMGVEFVSLGVAVENGLLISNQDGDKHENTGDEVGV